MNMLEPPCCTIRAAMRAEGPEAAAVVAAALETYRGALADHVLNRYIEDSRAVERQAGGGELIVAHDRGRIVGTVVYDAKTHGARARAGSPIVRTLMVLTQARGRGIGRRLMEHCIARARLDGASQIGLHTAAFMQHAVALYERMGFVRWPEDDLLASGLLGFDPVLGDVQVIAYRRDVVPQRTERVDSGDRASASPGQSR